MGLAKISRYFVEILHQPQRKISRHLAYLRNAGIVTIRRDGKWMHYRNVMPPNEDATGYCKRFFNGSRRKRPCKRSGQS